MARSRESYAAAGRIGGHVTQSRTDPKEATRAAAEGRFRKYIERVLDEFPELAGNDAEVIRRAEHLRKADMARLSLKAHEAKRRKRKAERDLAEAEAKLAEAAEDGAA